MQFVIPLSRDGAPLFRQVYLAFRDAILRGTLRAGARLPSTRELAEQLAISRTVVVLAYDQLLAEGFVEGRSGSGTYVSAGLAEIRHKTLPNSAKLRLSAFGRASAAAPGDTFPARQSSGLRYDFAYGQSDTEVFPFEKWRRIALRTMRAASIRELEYCPAAGSLMLREAICAQVRRSRAVVCDPSQLIIVNGSQQALDLAVRLLIERSDRVAIEDPQYQGTREVLLAAGARLCPVPVDRDGLISDRLPKNARAAFVTPSHQFPTGAILPLGRRLALLEWANTQNAVVIEDDYDGEFRYEGQPVESLQGLDTQGRVIYIGTFSRSIFPALRIGYLIAPHSLVPACTNAKWLNDRHSAMLEQRVLAEFIASGMYERHLRRVRSRNASRRKALLDAIAQYLGDRVTLTGEGAGAHVVIWPRKRVSENDVIARAASMDVRIRGLSAYFLSRPRRAGFILGYSRLNEDEIREGIRRLAEALPTENG